MESGGNLLKADASVDQGQQLRGIQAPEVTFGHLEQLPDQRRGGLDPLVALPGCRPQPYGGERGLHHVSRPQMPPVFLGKLIERDEALPIRL